jgi:hypothetical protein
MGALLSITGAAFELRTGSIAPAVKKSLSPAD